MKSRGIRIAQTSRIATPIRMKVRLPSRSSSMARPESFGRLALADRFRVGSHRIVDRGPRRADPDVLAEDRAQLGRICHDRVDLAVPLTPNIDCRACRQIIPLDLLAARL